MFQNIIKRNGKVEQCGILIGVPDMLHQEPPRAYRPVEVPNRARDTRSFYAVVAGDVAAALRAHGRTERHVVGFWHTHPVPSLPGPSQHDLDSIALGAKHWWHLVIENESGRGVWYDYYGNQFVTEDLFAERAVI